MKSPWVSRDMYDAACREIATLEENVRVARELYRVRVEDYRQLMKDYQVLKLAGAVIPEPERVIVKPPVDLVAEAINRASSGKDPKVRTAMQRQADIDKTAGLTPDEIAARIARGKRPAEDMT